MIMSVVSGMSVQFCLMLKDCCGNFSAALQLTSLGVFAKKKKNKSDILKLHDVNIV